MNKFYFHILGLIERIMYLPRLQYHKTKARRYSGEKDITLICNNCTGGVMLSDLGLRFNTPTINLLIRDHNQFIQFAKYCKEFCQQEVEPLCTLSSDGHPMGRLHYNNMTVDIEFTHYNTLEEGINKWEKRRRRITDNIIVIMEGPNISDNIIQQFNSIPYKKIIISKPRKEKMPSYYKGLDIYSDWRPGKIIKYRHKFSLIRNLDSWDYISFLSK